ncbi:MAG: 4,5-dihydroxyphthalate decarboxylase [Chloroflexota bacterium]|jgi:4,5-dihydroxyphthalate decarboxylase|nr:4,5-dihydroxyphthalate decarboxylase [Chloroflexota bacterium]
MGDVHLTLACGNYDRTRALLDGTVKPEGIDLTTIAVPTPERMFRMIQNDEFDVCESSSAMFLAGFEAGRQWIGLPVFPHRRFRHGYVLVNTEKGIERPEDLRGKRMGIAVYTNSAAVWVRGFLQHDFGVAPEEITWITAADEEVPEWEAPPGVRIERAPAGTRLQDWLVDGRIDAMMMPDLVEAFRDGSSSVRRLFPNFREVEEDYFRRTGFFPIMHIIIVRSAIIERYPWVGISMMKAFERSKQICFDYFRDQRKSSLAFFGAAWEEQRALMGPDAWPYTLERNRPTLEAMLEYAHEQGITRRGFTVDELFHPTTHTYDPIFDKTIWADR